MLVNPPTTTTNSRKATEMLNYYQNIFHNSRVYPQDIYTNILCACAWVINHVCIFIKYV